MTEARYPFVHVDATSDEGDAIAGALWDAGARGIEERDATTLHRPDAGAGTITLVASFEDETSARAAAAALGARHARVEFVVGDAWRDGWKEFFRPLRIGWRLAIEPSWRTGERTAGDVVVTIDPGNAFGTGQHESTRLVLSEIEARMEPGARVLDVGCGSGILAIAALRLGAARALAIDVDGDAVHATIENAARNGVADRLEAATTPVERVEGAYSLVVANVEEGALVALAPALIARVASGGLLVLSGILVGAEERVRRVYAALSFVAAPREGEWLALVLRREDR